MAASTPPATNDTDTGSETPSRRIAAVVGLRLLEVIRSQDLPLEILQDEDPSVTMPRRLGLSDVVERQIQAYREAVRRRRRMTDEELLDLVRLVIRRPDSGEVFYQAGRSLVGGGADPAAGVVRLLPDGVGFVVARRRVRTRLRRLFGRTLGSFTPGPFALEGESLLLWKADPGGDACAFVTGFCQATLNSVLGSRRTVVHSRCQGRRDDSCRWTVTAEQRSRQSDPETVGDLLRGPELEAG